MFEFGLSVAKRLWAGPLGLMPDALYSAFYGSALDAWAVADGSDLARGYLALMRMQKILVPISSKK